MYGKTIVIMVFLLLMSNTQMVSGSNASNQIYSSTQGVNKFDADESGEQDAVAIEPDQIEHEDEFGNEDDPTPLEDTEMWEDSMEQEEFDVNETAPDEMEVAPPTGVSDEDASTDDPVNDIESVNE